MMRCGVITLFVCVSFPLAISQIATLAGAQNEETTTTEPITTGFKKIQLPPFSQLAHNLSSGPITIIDEKTFYITNLYYDGLGPDAHFWAGKGSAPDSNGFLVPDEKASNKSLSAYTGQNVTIRLPDGVTVDQIDYLGMWCIKFTHNFGHVLIRPTPKLKSIEVGRFSQLAHNLSSGLITIIDEKTFFITNLYYDGKGPDAHFWVGMGSGASPEGILVPDEKGSRESISAYTGQDITIRLPGALTIYQIDYLAVWCIQYKHNFGQVLITDPIKYIQSRKDKKIIVPIQKCCALNQVLLSSGCAAENQDFNPILDVHEHNTTHVDDVPITAQIIAFQPLIKPINCEYSSYPLVPDEDEFSLLQNGSLMVLNTQTILPKEKYCMETINFGEDKNSDWKTTALVCFSSGEIPTSHTTFIIYATGITISAVCLFITALVFLLVKEVRDARGKCVVGYSLSMAVAFICLAVAQFSGIDDETCNIIGFVLQFFLVSSFTWLSMVSWETYYKIRKHDSDAYTNDRKRLYIYIAIGVGVPLLTLFISLVVDQIPDIPITILKPQFGKNTCFFDQKEGTMFYFYIPIGIAIAFNIVLAGLMKWNLVWFQKHRKGDISWITIKLELKPMFRSCLFLLCIMTLCWIMEIISFLIKGEGGFWIAIDIINSLQGVLVLVIFVLHRPVKDKICKVKNIRRNITQSVEDKPMTLLKPNGTATHANHNNHNNHNNDHNDFLTTLRHADSVEDMT